MSYTSTITLSGKSGKTYLFYCYPLNTVFAKAEGLYLFSKLVGNDHTLIYLGYTQDLSVRFDDHHKEECIKKNGANTHSVHWLSGKENLVAAETDILANYQFACNDTNN